MRKSAKATKATKRVRAASKFKRRPQEPKSEEARPAYDILRAAFDTADSFVDVFHRLRSGVRGAPTDEQQDLLRAMVVFAGAGLDAAAKQLASDALLLTTQRDRGSAEQLRSFVQRRLGRSATSRDVDSEPERSIATRADVDAKFLAGLLIADSPRAAAVADLIASIRAHSLQSREEILTAAARFGIPGKQIADDLMELEKAFQARNQIAHEMDVDLKRRERRRRSRTRDEMIAITQLLLDVGTRFLREVDVKLSQEPIDMEKGGERGPA